MINITRIILLLSLLYSSPSTTYSFSSSSLMQQRFHSHHHNNYNNQNNVIHHHYRHNWITSSSLSSTTTRTGMNYDDNNNKNNNNNNKNNHVNWFRYHSYHRHFKRSTARMMIMKHDEQAADTVVEASESLKSASDMVKFYIDKIQAMVRMDNFTINNPVYIESKENLDKATESEVTESRRIYMEKLKRVQMEHENELKLIQMECENNKRLHRIQMEKLKHINMELETEFQLQRIQMEREKILQHILMEELKRSQMEMEEVKRSKITLMERDKELLRIQMKRDKELQRILMEELKRIQMEMKDKIKEYIINLGHKEQSTAPMSYVASGRKWQNTGAPLSYAALGQKELIGLRKHQLIIEAEILNNEAPFLSEEDQAIVNAIQNEADFVAFMTPVFNKVLDSFHMEFVNSEICTWLSQSELSPENCDMYIKKKKGIYLQYGVPEKKLDDRIIVFESKLTITDESFGQVAVYLSLLDVATSCAILFDRTSFWLITSKNGVIIKVIISKWVHKGSKKLFWNFIANNKSHWISRLANACTLLNVNLVEGEAFLGRGITGHVFKVKRGDDVFALKIVEYMELLQDEKLALDKSHFTGLTCSPIGEVMELDDGGAALLLTPVGEPLPRPTTEVEVKRILQFLRQLHKENLLHGDPRIPNVIVHGEKLLWFDLKLSRDTDESLQRDELSILTRSDLSILTQSILNVSHEDLLNDEFMQLIENYGDNSTDDNTIDILATKICEFK